MKHLFVIIAATMAMIASTMADPEVRRAIPVGEEMPEMAGEPQVRRAIPVRQAAIDAEMQAAAEAIANPADPATVEAEPAATPVPAPIAEREPELVEPVAADIDYSQEPGLPVEWKEYTIEMP